jgi:hypothetical protein
MSECGVTHRRSGILKEGRGSALGVGLKGSVKACTSLPSLDGKRSRARELKTRITCSVIGVVDGRSSGRLWIWDRPCARRYSETNPLGPPIMWYSNDEGVLKT